MINIKFCTIFISIGRPITLFAYFTKNITVRIFKMENAMLDWFFQKNGYRLFACSPALPKVKEAIDKLRSYGQVIIVTYQKTFKNKMDTLMWLNEHGIEYDGICFLKNKTLLHTDWLIDDNWWNFKGCNAKHGVLIDAPYNKDVDVEELWFNDTNCIEPLRRFGSLDEFANWYESEA